MPSKTALGFNKSSSCFERRSYTNFQRDATWYDNMCAVPPTFAHIICPVREVESVIGKEGFWLTIKGLALFRDDTRELYLSSRRRRVITFDVSPSTCVPLRANSWIVRKSVASDNEESIKYLPFSQGEDIEMRVRQLQPLF